MHGARCMEEKDILLRIKADVGDAKQALESIQGTTSRLKVSFTELNQALELAGKGFRFIRSAVDTVRGLVNEASRLADAGDKINDVTAAFENLSSAAGKTSSQFLSDLNTATDNAISNFDLMRSASKGLTLDLESSGISITELAGNIKKFSDATGRDFVGTFETFSSALATGRVMSLQTLGLTIDITKANNEYAASLGKTADQLTETEKRTAKQQASFQALQEQVGKLTDSTRGAGDAAQSWEKALADAGNEIVAGIDKSENLAEAFDELAKTLKLVDWESFGELAGGAFSLILNALNFATIPLRNFLIDLQNIRDIYKYISDRAAQLGFKDATSGQQLVNRLGTLEEQARKIDASKPNSRIGSFLGVNAANKQTKEELEKVRAQLTELYTPATRAAGAIDKVVNTDTPAGGGSTAKEIKSARDQLDAFARALEKQDLSRGIEKALSSGTAVDSALLTQLRKNVEDSVLSGFSDALANGGAEATQAMELAKEAGQRAVDEVLEKQLQANTRAAEQLEEENKRAFAASVSFFEDLFMNAITGVTFDLEDTLKRVAVGFASQVAASVTGISFQGGAAGLGQSLASSIGFGLTQQAGSFGIGQALGLSGITGGSIIPSTAPAGVLGPSTSGIGAGPLTLVAGSVILGGVGVSDILKGKTPNAASRLTLGIATGGLSEIGIFGADAFGSGKDPDQKRRDALRDRLREETGLGEDLSFLGATGQRLSLSEFNVDFSREFADQAVALTQGLGDIFGGGGKLGDDLTGMFANAILEGENFNQILLNAQSLMTALGISADDAKQSLLQSFYDGKISLEEFGAGLQSINTLTQEGLPGVADVAGAVELIGQNFGNHQNQVQAFGLLLNEMAEGGIDSFEELSAILGDELAPEIQSVIDQLAGFGLDTFEKIKNATPDQVHAIITSLQPVKSAILDALGASSEEAATITEDSSEKIVKSYQRVEDQIKSVGRTARETTSDIIKLNKAASSKPQTDPNPDLGKPA